jgi:hypothetical protein
MSLALPPEVERFLVDHVDSVAELEALAYLHANPDVDVAPDAVARALGVDPAWARAELERLASRGVVARGETPGTCRFASSPPASRRSIDAVMAAYRERRVSVIELIITKPSRHVLSFADAFRLRKD